MRNSSKILIFAAFSIALWKVDAWNGNNYDYQNNYYSQQEVLSNESIWELERIGEEIKYVTDKSVNKTRYPCNSYYDYICGSKMLFNSILGSMPRINDIVLTFNSLRNDNVNFDSKDKLIRFFDSCAKVKNVDDCYVESFENFRPLFGYIISRKFVNTADIRVLRDVLDHFVRRAKQEGYFTNHQNLKSLQILNQNIEYPAKFFYTLKLDTTYRNLTIHPSYRHNVINLEEYNRLYRNSSDYETHWKSVLDFTIYLYQSRNKPRSYYYPTLNVHLWMTLFNNTVRYHDGRTYNDLANCFKLPKFLDVLEEARYLAVIYFKAFKFAWDEYAEWFNDRHDTSNYHHARARDIFDKENEILGRFGLNNKYLFFIFYAQNFCYFGKDLAENIFYQGLKHNIEFISIYQCNIGDNMNAPSKCF